MSGRSPLAKINLSLNIFQAHFRNKSGWNLLPISKDKQPMPEASLCGKNVLRMKEWDLPLRGTHSPLSREGEPFGTVPPPPATRRCCKLRGADGMPTPSSGASRPFPLPALLLPQVEAFLWLLEALISAEATVSLTPTRSFIPSLSIYTEHLLHVCSGTDLGAGHAAVNTHSRSLTHHGCSVHRQ